MKIFIYIFFFIFIFQSCEKFQLLPITAENIHEQISTYKGEKAVLVNVWALWCAPCVEEFPMIVSFHNKIKDLEVIFISADFEDQFQDVVEFLNKHDVGPKSYIKDQKDEPFIQGIHHSWTGSLPFTIVYAKESGSIIDLWEGKEPESRFISAIKIATNS